MLRDRDAVYGRAFAAQTAVLGIDTLLTPYRAPRANALAERVIRTLRQGCLDHVLILKGRHLERVLAEYLRPYNADRPHRSLSLTPPLPSARARRRAPPSAVSSCGRCWAASITSTLARPEPHSSLAPCSSWMMVVKR